MFLKNRPCGQADVSCVRYAEIVFYNVEMVDGKTGALDIRNFNVRMDVNEQAILVGRVRMEGRTLIRSLSVWVSANKPSC